MKLRPLFDRVVLTVEKKETKNPLGLILPTDEKGEQVGMVVAVGNGGMIDDKLVKMEVKIGDRVLFSKFAGTEIKIDGEKYLVIRQTDILAVID